MALSKIDWELVVEGAALLGSGGGGSLAAGRALGESLGEGPWADPVRPGALPPKTKGCVVADFGAATAFSRHQVEALLAAFDALEARTFPQGGRFEFVMPVETGPENSMAPLVVAVHRGRLLLDADPCGRAIPRLTMCPLAGRNPGPTACANGRGTVVVAEAPSGADLEALLRPLGAARAFGSSASLALFPRTIRQLEGKVVDGAWTRARAVGQACADRPPTAVLIERLRAMGLSVRPLFSGVLSRVTEPSTGGFNEGRAWFRSPNDEAVAVLENEAMVFWSRGSAQPLATAPTGIGFYSSEVGPLTAAEFPAHRGRPVDVLAFAPEAPLVAPGPSRAFRDFLDGVGYPGPFVL